MIATVDRRLAVARLEGANVRSVSKAVSIT